MDCSAWMNRDKASVRRRQETPLTEEQCATKIQAGYRGLLARESWAQE